MQNKLVVFVLFAVVMLLFGCTSQPKLTEQPEEKELPAGETTEGGEKRSGPTEEDGTIGLGGITGPIKCEIELTDPEAGLVKSIYYHDWVSKLRIETETQGVQTIMIMKDNTVYTKISEEMRPAFPECDWMKISLSTSQSDIKSTEPEDFDTSMKSYSKMPNYKVSCTPWVVDPSLFETPGKICDMPTYG